MDSAIPCSKNKNRRALPHAKGVLRTKTGVPYRMQKEITSMLTKEIVRTIGIDVHSETYSISTYNPKTETFIGECTVEAEAKNVIRYVSKLRKETAIPVSIDVGYEAGPTGFGLKRELEKAGIRCNVMAPTSIYRPAAGVRVKTDARDARSLAKAVYWGSYSEVMPLSEEDEAYRDYIRMRDDRNDELKRGKAASSLIPS